MVTQFLNVSILSPKQTIFDGKALSLSSKNSAGKFDILPQHANFITLVENEPIILVLPTPIGSGSGKKSLKYTFPIAIIYTSQNLVKVYTDITL